MRGCTVLPVWPTWWSAEIQPASTTARLEPTTPPRTPASSSASLMPPSTSLEMPRPTETTTSAPIRSTIFLAAFTTSTTSTWMSSLDSFTSTFSITVLAAPASS